jgi:tRNA nucleotidyltransferase/poly(A) polymerase
MAAEIELTALEREIFEILISTVAYQGKSTVLRAAGGWVRDKLLGLPSDDIDIALNDQSGSEFAVAINAYLLSRGLETHTVAVIHANPEQSKHLETARMKVLGLELDFVNLRTETYTSQSRIPTIAEEFGSPLEDALRRDFTINSLFFNLQSGQVEDFTGHGLIDLRDGLIRTPLDPSVTFTDDPLRMLRAVRFSSRFAYRLHESVREVACHPDTHTALQLKVSKERQLKELSGCLSGQMCRPILAITTLHDLGLFSTVFALPPVVALTGDLQADLSQSLYGSLEEMTERWERCSLQCAFWTNSALHILSNLLTAPDSPLLSAALFPPPLPPVTAITALSNPLFIPAALLSSPMRDIPLADSPRPLCSAELFWTACVSGLGGVSVKEKKGKTVLLSQAVLRDSLKVDNDTLKAVGLTLQAARSFQALCNSDDPLGSLLAPASQEARSSLRETLGLILRDCKHHWRGALVIACSLALSSQEPHHLPSPTDPLELQSSHLRIIDLYRRVGVAVMTLHLDEVWGARPHYDGDALIAELQMRRGPLLGQVIERQFRWQLRYPDRPREECLEYLRTELALLASSGGR